MAEIVAKHLQEDNIQARKNNVILYKCKSPGTTEHGQRQVDDRKFVDEMCEAVLKSQLQNDGIVKMFRLG